MLLRRDSSDNFNNRIKSFIGLMEVRKVRSQAKVLEGRNEENTDLYKDTTTPNKDRSKTAQRNSGY